MYSKIKNKKNKKIYSKIKNIQQNNNKIKKNKEE